MLRVDCVAPDEFETNGDKDIVTFSISMLDLQSSDWELFQKLGRVLKQMAMKHDIAFVLRAEDSVEEPIPTLLQEVADVVTRHDSTCRLTHVKNRYLEEHKEYKRYDPT